MKPFRKFQVVIIFTIILIGCKKDNEVQPMAITVDATDLMQTSATLNGFVNANGLTTSVIFEYGTTSGYGDTITLLLNNISGKTEMNVSANISGLTPNTIYHFRIAASNLAGKTEGSDCTFTTLEQLTWLKVGIAKPEILLKDIIPDTVLTAPWCKDANYNLDLNNDYYDDINIRVYTIYIGGGLVLGNAGVNIKTLNNETFVLTDNMYPYALSYGDSIKINDKWGNGNLTLDNFFQSYPPVGSGTHSGNGRFNNNYIGIKSFNRLGWIKLDTYITSFKVYEYALQK